MNKALSTKVYRQVTGTVVAVATGLASAVAVAAPPDLTAVTGVFADAESTATSLFGAAMPVVGAVAILFIAIKMFKRFASKV